MYSVMQLLMLPTVKSFIIGHIYGPTAHSGNAADVGYATACGWFWLLEVSLRYGDIIPLPRGNPQLQMGQLGPESAI